MTKPIIQQLADRIGWERLGEPETWTTYANARMFEALCSYLDEQAAPPLCERCRESAHDGPCMPHELTTALDELRAVPGATSANAERDAQCLAACSCVTCSPYWPRDTADVAATALRQLDESRSALAASEARIQELTGKLAWEKAWDLHRKADMQAVVEAARGIRFGVGPIGYQALSDALSALDARVEPVGERVLEPTCDCVRAHRCARDRCKRCCYCGAPWRGDPAPPISESATREE